MTRAGLLLGLTAFLFAAPWAGGQSRGSAEERTARYLQSIRHQPLLTLAFLREMPKGGDLHNHLAGAVYAESWIDFAVDDNLCVDRTTSVLIAPPCDASCERFTSKPAIRCAYGDHVLYNSMIDAWSMRNWNPGEESGHDHFFATFDKFLLASQTHAADAIADAARQAAADHLQYVELMHTADGLEAAHLGIKIGWDEHLPELRDKLLAGGLKDIAAATSKKLDVDESKMRSRLKCGTAEANSGCDVNIRYLYQVLRGLPPEAVFAQILLGFELASSDPRFVGLNLVMPEDWYVPMHDFGLHMKMLDYLHEVYPKVHISLHAGELAFGLVPAEGVTFHIRDSIERGHAERIGHGVDIMNEHDPIGLLREMARHNVLVEICLTSNDLILGIAGNDHPLPTYMRYGVSVALATDDEGVSRSDMTHEYLRAVETYDSISYRDLKRMARLSLEHSFVPGASFWTDPQNFRMVRECTATATEKPFSTCERFLATNERAKLQRKLEQEFTAFEKKY
ncbi:MAG TPA: adenosine deaminase [Terriglobales bacterium]|nr:adenosine deaminase [Terriglobales bacterium]